VARALTFNPRLDIGLLNLKPIAKSQNKKENPEQE
jgi:hypothetical protein